MPPEPGVVLFCASTCLLWLYAEWRRYWVVRELRRPLEPVGWRVLVRRQMQRLGVLR